MAKNQMDKIATILQVELERPFRIKGYGINPCRLTKYHLLNSAECSIPGHLVCLLTGEYEIEEDDKVEQNFQLDEVVFTADKYVLDIGVVRSLDPLKIEARWSWTRAEETPYYGAPHLSRWIKSGCFSTPERWKEISMDQSTEYICNHFNIPYERR